MQGSDFSSRDSGSIIDHPTKNSDQHVATNLADTQILP
jgi:hypothetical protein